MVYSLGLMGRGLGLYCDTVTLREASVAKELKIATFNVEWMVNLFENGKPIISVEQNKRAPGLGSKPKRPSEVAERIAGVIQSLDADVVSICEGPPLKSQMQEFVKSNLDGAYNVFSVEDGSQSVHILVSKRLPKELKVSQVDESDAIYKRLQRVKNYHQFGSVSDSKKGRFTRMPVILRVVRGDAVTELMAVHTKSKISDLKKATQWEQRSRDAIISAINSRQKLSIEMNEIRKYIAHGLYSDRADSVIVMGDLNDGISRDVVDDTYLLHSIVHELRGAFHHEIALMRHVLTPEQLQHRKESWTVQFRDPAQKEKQTKVLLDHMLFSPKCWEGGRIRFQRGSGRIEHEAYEKFVTNKGKTRDDRPSDHRPLSALFDLA